MRVETKLFLYMVPFFLLVGTVYGFMTAWLEPVGFLGIWLVAALSAMVGGYLGYTGRRVGARPEDRTDGEIHEGAGEQGFFSPWSWWPLSLAAGAAVVMLGMAVGVWIVFIGLFLGVIGLVGWVFEYSRGQHSH